MTIYTKNGRPLHRSGDNLFSSSGAHVAKLNGSKAYDSDGKYVGTLVNQRLIYRSMDSTSRGSPFAKTSQAGFANAKGVSVSAMGEEPPIPD
jgi:hypothetical protein